MLNLGPVYSIGGCVVHEVAKRISKFSEGHADHFWRRPTIALMSNPIDRFHFNIHELPPAFVNYFINDASSSHRREIENLPSRGSVFIDITRDIFTGVIEIEPGKFILNPLDGVDIVEDLNTDTISDKILSNILKSNFQQIGHDKDRDAFLKLWEKHIDLMINMLTVKFDNVFILEIYFTDRIANNGQNSNIDGEYAQLINSVLSEMYEKIRHRSDSIFVSIDQNKMITGTQVEWGGPTYTHFIEETYALFCDRVLQMMTQGKSDFSFIEEASLERARAHEKTIFEFDRLKEEVDAGHSKFAKKTEFYEGRIKELSEASLERARAHEETIFEFDRLKEEMDANHSKFAQKAESYEGRIKELSEASLERARAHEETIFEFDRLKEEMDANHSQLAQKAESYEIRISELSDEISRRPTHVAFEAQRVMISQRDGELEELRRTSRTHLHQMQEVQAELARSRSTQGRLEKELALARQSVFAQTKKSVARMTYRLRRGSR